MHWSGLWKLVDAFENSAESFENLEVEGISVRRLLAGSSSIFLNPPYRESLILCLIQLLVSYVDNCLATGLPCVASPYIS